MSDHRAALDRLADAYAALDAIVQLSRLDEAAVVVGAILDDHRDDLDDIRADLLTSAMNSIRVATEALDTTTSRDVAPTRPHAGTTDLEDQR